MTTSHQASESPKSWRGRIAVAGGLVLLLCGGCLAPQSCSVPTDHSGWALEASDAGIVDDGGVPAYDPEPTEEPSAP